MINKLSTGLRQTAPYYVNRLMTKELIININCNPLVKIKTNLLLSSFLCLLEFFFSNFYYLSFPKGLEVLLLIVYQTLAQKLNEIF